MDAVRPGVRVRVIRDVTAEALEELFLRKVERLHIGAHGTIVEMDEQLETGGFDEDDAGRLMVDVQLDSGATLPFYLEELDVERLEEGDTRHHGTR